MGKTGFIHGRFQVLHNDHMKYLLAGMKRCDFLVVGITNPDPGMTGDDEADPHRSRADENPLTFYERMLMVRDALVEAGVSLDQFAVVPFPINFPELYKYYAPLDAVFFLTVYDDWGEKKLSMFQNSGLKTEIMWRRPIEEKGLSALYIRKLIADDGPWREFVPSSVAVLIEKFNVRERLTSL